MQARQIFKKITLFGDISAGLGGVMKKYINSNIDSDTGNKKLNFDNQEVKIQLNILLPKIRFRNNIPRNALCPDAVIIGISATTPNPSQALRKLLSEVQLELEESRGKQVGSINKIIVITKAESLSQDELTAVVSQVNLIAKENGMQDCYVVNEKTGENIEAAFNSVISKMLSSNKKSEDKVKKISSYEEKNSLDFDTFKREYYKAYNSVFFKNPFSTMKKLLDKNDSQMQSISDVEEYAKNNASSRTAEVLKRLTRKI